MCKGQQSSRRVITCGGNEAGEDKTKNNMVTFDTLVMMRSVDGAEAVDGAKVKAVMS